MKSDKWFAPKQQPTRCLSCGSQGIAEAFDHLPHHVWTWVRGCGVRNSSHCPSLLQEALNRGYILTPERTIPDLVTVISEKQRTRNPTAPQPATGGSNSEEEDEEEEEVGVNVYLNKDSERFSGEISSKGSGNMSGGRTLAVEAEPTSQTAEVTQEDGAKSEKDDAPCSPEGQTAVQAHVTGGEVEEDELREVEEDSSEDVDLFSVTLAALAVCEEEEQHTEDCETNRSGLYSQEPLLPTESGSCDQTAVQHEEEFSAYIRHDMMSDANMLDVTVQQRQYVSKK